MPGSPQLGAMTARPYRLALVSNASPGAVIAQLREDDRPGALWGDWFGGGVLIFHRPLEVQEPVNASEGFGYLDELPRLADSGSVVRSGMVGGGWLACFGYDPKTTTLAFYDSLLRWQPDSGWSFESLGLSGRERENASALQSLDGAAGICAGCTDRAHCRSDRLASRLMLNPLEMAISLLSKT